jgi:hypothetical protein
MNDLYEYWYSLQPRGCHGCECSHLIFGEKGDPVWDCELEECYQENPITIGMEDRGE